MPSLSGLRKKINEKADDAVAAVSANYPPQMSGQNSTDFRSDTAAMAADCDLILLDPFFAGITPSLLTQTPGSTLIDWFETVAQDTDALMDISNPTSAQKQEAADGYATMSDLAGDLNTAYTV